MFSEVFEITFLGKRGKTDFIKDFKKTKNRPRVLSKDLRDKFFYCPDPECPVPKFFESSRKIPFVPLTKKTYTDIPS
jgi:hypothetical protein